MFKFKLPCRDKKRGFRRSLVPAVGHIGLPTGLVDIAVHFMWTPTRDYGPPPGAYTQAADGSLRQLRLQR